MPESANSPIFVVGSPRSGTSILTWCLGQHPNILAVPESSWMADFAINVAISHQIVAAGGDRSILSAMDISRDEFFANFGHSINDLIIGHRHDLGRKRKLPSQSSHPKLRWVDGTPEYSLHIYGLRKLFPKALFIHILRDVTSVVRSMLNFHRVAGIHLVANEEEAYQYWLRTVQACVKAEQAYGPDVVFRLPYMTLIDSPESAIRALLDFIGERYSGDCLAPLAQRMNSSNVPDDFVAEDPATNPSVAREARGLWSDLDKTPQASIPSVDSANEIEAAFQNRVKYIANLDNAYQQTRQAFEAYKEARL